MRIRLFAKTILAVLFCASTFAATEADRSWSREHRYAISGDPFSWTSGNFRAQLEGSFNDRMSLVIPVAFGVKETIFKNKYFGGGYFAPKVGVKYYITGKATHQGFYANPLLGFFVGKLEGINDATAGLTYGFRMGYSWNVWHGLWVDSYVGYESFATSFNGDKNQNGNAGTAAVPTNDSLFGSSLINVGLLVGYNW